MAYWPLRQRHIGPIGLDIGHAYIKMVQLACDTRGLHVLAAQRCPYPQDRSVSTVKSTIRRLWEAGRFRGRKVVASIPNEGLRVTSVRTSPEDLAQAPTQFYQSLAQRFGLDLERETVRHLSAGTIHQADQTRHEVILLAADNAEIDERVHLLMGSGLVPQGLDPVACALFRCYDQTMQRHEDQTQSLLYVDIGDVFTTVTFAREHQLCFVKQLPIGATQIAERVAQILGVDKKEADTLRQRVQQWILSSEESLERLYEPEAGQPVGLDRSTQHLIRDAVTAGVQELSHEIALCMRYYSVTFRGYQANQLLLSGAVAEDRILQRSLSQQLSVDVIAAAPFDLLHRRGDKHETDPQGPSSQWAVALGLALKGLDTSPLHTNRAQTHSLVPALQPVGGDDA